MRPGFDNNVAVFLIIEFDLSIKAYQEGKIFPLSKNSLSDTQKRF